MLRAGSTTDEHCGGIDKTLVHEIAEYQGCLRGARWPAQPVSCDLLSTTKMYLVVKYQQIVGQPWNLREKSAPTIFFRSGTTAVSDTERLPRNYAD